MAGVEVKSVSSPDETRPFADKGQAGMINIGGHSVLYGTFEPGWRWSEHVKPVAGTEKCEATHLLYCMSGRMKIAHDDGTEAEIGPAMSPRSSLDTRRGSSVTRPSRRSTSAATRSTGRPSPEARNPRSRGPSSCAPSRLAARPLPG